jgi:arylsulfatase A-like enzyme
VAVISDHGHNLGHEPGDKGLISKQGHPMTHAVADLVLMMRHPEGQGAGTTYDGLIYNLDVTSTFAALSGVDRHSGGTWGPLDGINLWPKALNGEPAREHVTIGWGPLVTVVTDEWWYNANIWGEGELLYRAQEDPNLEHSLAGDRPEVCKAMLNLAIQDAGGSIPPEFIDYHDKPGCTPFEDRSTAHRALFTKK